MSEQTSLTSDLLKRMMEGLPKDPLLEKGIGKDWVCVINPALVSAIKEEAKKFPQQFMTPLNELDVVMGRRVFIINEAPRTIEYMDELTMRVKYQEHFKNENLLIAINRVKRIIELNGGVYIDVRREGEWTYFRYFVSENDPEPFQTKKIATGAFEEMDWSYVAMLIMQAPSEPKS